ncbi:MAG TPA: LysO family transporter, partial [Clostridia bacterium]|nr:LysO family transporter [Clostridia bacterium]
MSASSFWVFLSIGLLVGWFRIVPRRLGDILDRISLIALILLLSGMGAQIGANPKVIPLAGTMGFQAALISAFAMAGSVLMVLPFERFLFSTAERAEAAARRDERRGMTDADVNDREPWGEHAPGPGHYVEEAQSLESRQARADIGQGGDGDRRGGDSRLGEGDDPRAEGDGRRAEGSLASRLVKVVLGSVVAGITIGYA